MKKLIAIFSLIIASGGSLTYGQCLTITSTIDCCVGVEISWTCGGSSGQATIQACPGSTGSPGYTTYKPGCCDATCSNCTISINRIVNGTGSCCGVAATGITLSGSPINLISGAQADFTTTNCCNQTNHALVSGTNHLDLWYDCP